MESMKLTPEEISAYQKENLITLAVALIDYVQIYTFDCADIRGVATKRSELV